MIARVLMLVLLLGPRASADDMRPAARALLQRGLRAYNVQQYEEAIEAFRAGYQLDPRRDFLYALGQAERLSGDCRAAIEAYRAFLRTGPPSLQASSARKNLARCEDELAHAPAAPSPAPVAAPPSPAPIVIISPPPPPTRRPAWYRDAAGDTLLALGVAGLGAGGALWGVGQSAIDRANAATSYDEFTRLHDAAGSAGAERIAGIACVAVGGALVIAAIVRYAIHVRGR